VSLNKEWRLPSVRRKLDKVKVTNPGRWAALASLIAIEVRLELALVAWVEQSIQVVLS
jgi:hypothetical protein